MIVILVSMFFGLAFKIKIGLFFGYIKWLAYIRVLFVVFLLGVLLGRRRFFRISVLGVVRTECRITYCFLKC